MCSKEKKKNVHFLLSGWFSTVQKLSSIECSSSSFENCVKGLNSRMWLYFWQPNGRRASDMARKKKYIYIF